MAHILVLYGTTDGHTAKVARYLAAELNMLGCFAEAVNARLSPRVKAKDYDAVLVAASVHAGGYQRAVRVWVAANAADLATRPGAFISVCLGVLQKKAVVDRELNAMIRRFFAQLRWQPLTVKIVAGALPYTRYNVFKKWIMRRIAAKAGTDTDTSRDYEYTDWADLAAFAGRFARAHRLVTEPSHLAEACSVQSA